jgi:hypothetical protein
VIGGVRHDRDLEEIELPQLGDPVGPLVLVEYRESGTQGDGVPFHRPLRLPRHLGVVEIKLAPE